MRDTFLLLLLVPQLLWAQFPEDKKEKFPTYFAFGANAIFPNNFQGTKTFLIDRDYTKSTITQMTGFNFGGLFRRSYTDRISIEAGLNYSTRRFDIQALIVDSNLTTRDTMKFTTLEIPVNGLVFVKMSENVYSNVGFGLSFLYKPSTVRVFSRPDDKSSIDHYGVVRNKFGMDLNGQVGAEIRTYDKGIFYLGGSVRVPLSPLFTMLSSYKYGTQDAQTGTQQIQGGYISLDIRYYFHNVKNKGQQPLVSPMGE